MHYRGRSTLSYVLRHTRLELNENASKLMRYIQAAICALVIPNFEIYIYIAHVHCIPSYQLLESHHQSLVSSRRQTFSSHVHTAHGEIPTVGFARNPFLILISTLIMPGLLTMDYHLVTDIVEIGKSSWVFVILFGS